MLTENTTFDIVGFIEKNPLSRLEKTYQDNLINKIKSEFTEDEQKLFVTSFFCYLNFNPTTDFVIDFDDVWKWCGFSRKDNAKRILEKHFKIDTDYKIALLRPEARKNEGGFNKEKITLNIKTFKKYCLKSDTEKSSEIHNYYIKLEEILQDLLIQQTDELKLQLEEKDNKLIEKENQLDKQFKQIKLLEKKTQKKTERIEQGKNVVYILTNEYLKNDRIFVIGKAINLANRLSQYNKTSDHEVIYSEECNNAKQMSLIEQTILYKLDKYRERACRDRFILPESCDISFFKKILSDACNWFKDVDKDVIIETDYDEKEYYEDNKEYIKEYKKQHYEENKEDHFKKGQAWYEENKEKVQIYNKQYREENKEKIQIQHQKYKEEHKEEYKKRNAEYYQKNKEEIEVKKKQYAEENKDKIKEQRNGYYQKNIEEIRARDRARNPKVMCECGLSICRRSLPAHQKSKTHERFMKINNEQQNVLVIT